jgi:hypothetical protein
MKKKKKMYTGRNPQSITELPLEHSISTLFSTSTENRWHLTHSNFCNGKWFLKVGHLWNFGSSDYTQRWPTQRGFTVLITLAD